MAKAKRKRKTRYVIVHRGPGNEVLPVSEPFQKEDEGSEHAMRLLRHINFFVEDSLRMEDDEGQAEKATNS